MMKAIVSGLLALLATAAFSGCHADPYFGNEGENRFFVPKELHQR